MDEYIFKTSRLAFRKWKESDFIPFREMNLDEKVMEFFPKTLADNETFDQIDKINGHFAIYGYGLYATDKLETGEFNGFIGFTHPGFESFFTPCVEIGWRIKSIEWNQGYATEGAIACLEYGFKKLHFDKVYSFTSVLNIKSEKIMQKIGMEKIGEFDYPKLEEGHKLRRHVVYRIGGGVG